MNLKDIPQIYKNLSRTAEIIAVLSRYGLAEWLDRLGIDLSILPFPNKEKINDLTTKTFGERLRLALAELGPSFIKLGQILSTRADLVAPEVLEELRKLQSNANVDPSDWVKEHVESALGSDKMQHFSDFSYQAFASASIGQVHDAVLSDGTPVVVKVRHKNIVKVINKDLEIVLALANLASKSPELAIYDPKGIAQEFARTLRQELDFRRELQNLKLFKANFHSEDDVVVPETYEELSSETLLTMEKINGIGMEELSRLEDRAGYDLEHLAKRGAEIFLEMVFEHGLFHADPHPGNFIIKSGNRIGLIDFGMVGYLDDDLREEIENMLVALLHNDPDLLTSIILRLGNVPRDIDKAALKRDIREFVSFYGSLPISELPLAKTLEDLLAIIRRHYISLPTQVAMLIKVLIMLEGTSHLLNPNFSMMEILQPLQQRILMRRLSPERNLKKLRRFQDQIEHAMSKFPGQLMEIVDKVQKGDLEVGLNHTGLSTSLNRLVLGLIASALFLGGSFMLSVKVRPLLFQTEFYGFKDMSLFGIVVMLYSFHLIFKLFRAIKRSGRL
ncbi:AarF/ABC1/UbiB kinase family protein [Oligoflexaceae bacterium]|nr:AarF/ABC1/UbiB kinase family protein [Oligoflexaceae bacterium]